jgi:hypothetical protein
MFVSIYFLSFLSLFLGGWLKVGQREGVRIMEQIMSPLSSHSHSNTTGLTPAINGSAMKQDGLLDALLAPSLPLPLSLSNPSHSQSQSDVSHPSGVVCRKSQTVIACSPVKVFLALMDTSEGGHFWPQQHKGATLKVSQYWND